MGSVGWNQLKLSSTRNRSCRFRQSWRLGVHIAAVRHCRCRGCAGTDAKALARGSGSPAATTTSRRAAAGAGALASFTTPHDTYPHHHNDASTINNEKYYLASSNFHRSKKPSTSRVTASNYEYLYINFINKESKIKDQKQIRISITWYLYLHNNLCLFPGLVNYNRSTIKYFFGWTNKIT